MPSQRFMKKRSKFARKFKPRITYLTKGMKKQVSQIARRIDLKNEELKFRQQQYGQSVSDSWTGPSSYLFIPAQGTAGYGDYQDLQNSASQRIGNEIFIRSLKFNYTVYQGDTSNVLRIIIFQWLQQDRSNFPTIGDIIMGTGGTAPWQQPLNYQNRKSFKILYDVTHTLSEQAGNSSVINRKVDLARKLKVRKVKTATDGQSGYNSLLVTGNIYYMLVSDSSVVAHPSIVWTNLLLFNDA